MIITGTQKKKIKIGIVADFCPICREINPFRVYRVGMASHLYYFSFGEGELVGHVAQCQSCRAFMVVDPILYSSFEKHEPKELNTLIQKTFPDIRNFYAERLDIEDRIKRNLPIEELADREGLILEPFYQLADQVEERFKENTKLDKECGIGCLGTVILIALTVAVPTTFWKKNEMTDNLCGVAMLLIFCAFLYTVIQIILAPRRFVRRIIIPNLVKCLSPLKPTKQEIITCLNKFKTTGFKIGRKISSKKLWAAFEANDPNHLIYPNPDKPIKFKKGDMRNYSSRRTPKE